VDKVGEVVKESSTTEEKPICWTWWYIPVIPATWEVETGRIAVGVQSQKKVSEISSQRKDGHGHIHYNSSCAGDVGRRSMAQDQS
jgi:hypothetical protein